ncbi:hypothetical protein [Bacillus sp. TL12]|uniref:hypothetical protein n=1 Tax=Bacillus sp. TL12 TaxID=2894756 RepID=UPI001F51F1A1|nr:hypothetical protein [Bacillus sp. TL12]MCI0767542.1 hypothetical protein [Bacillus sp. TL12]
MNRFSLDDLESVVRGGKAVIAAADSIVIAAVQDAVRKGRTATFYLTRDQFTAVRQWYWTPKRFREYGLEPVSDEEKARIQSELGIKEDDIFYSNRIKCQCGHVYGAFEFMQQGINEHGREAVESVFNLKDTYVMRVNSHQEAICPNCKNFLRESHYYDMRRYGCARVE